ncbi:MAG: hypothetical protein OIN66_10130 [Candidatus Methanoperedens sp.]|nr:hypothetical protein [Candidatus Methanoperedens sp.]
MGLTDIPTSFGSSFFIRIFFPASIATALYSLAFYGVLKGLFWFGLSFENKILVLLIISLVIGILLSICDIYIYQLYEGIWGWPNFLKKIFYNRQIKKFKTLDNELETTYDKISNLEKNLKNLNNSEKEKANVELWLLNRRLCQLSAELRKFPYNPDYNSYCQRYPEKPTEFGNVIAEYELYSQKQYGMDMMVFWQHLWLILPKESKDDLDLRSARADFNVYMSVLLLLFLPIGTIGFWFQPNTWYQIFYWNIPVAAIISFLISLLGWFAFYRISISEHKAYGRYIKAVFDLYRFDLAKKLDIKISIFPEIEKNLWEKQTDYFLDYTLPENI